MRPLDNKFLLLLTVFISVLAILNVISGKLVDFSFWPSAISAGIICYWITFPITDVVSEVYGKEKAQFFVWMGFLTNALVLGLSTWAVHLNPHEIYGNQEAFATTLGSVPKIVIASLCAYLAAQTHDVWAYHFWKKVTKGKHMWLRNNLSTISSQLIDSIIFTAVAFLIWGDMSFDIFVTAVASTWALKLCIAIVDTPMVYVLHYGLTGYWSPDKKMHPFIYFLPCIIQIILFT